MLFAQKAENGTIEDCLYRLYEKGLYNAVVWLDDNQMDFDRLKRLRALGMNMVCLLYTSYSVRFGAKCK